MQPNVPETVQRSSPVDPQERPQPASNLLRFLKQRWEAMDDEGEGVGEIWLVDDATGEVLDRAIVRKNPDEGAAE